MGEAVLQPFTTSVYSFPVIVRMYSICDLAFQQYLSFPPIQTSETGSFTAWTKMLFLLRQTMAGIGPFCVCIFLRRTQGCSQRPPNVYQQNGLVGFLCASTADFDDRLGKFASRIEITKPDHPWSCEGLDVLYPFEEVLVECRQ